MRRTQRLDALKVRDLKEPGRHADGDGLYLQIDKDGSRYWIFMWKRGGKRRVMGLGPERKVSLAAARRKAKDADRKIDDGLDPIDERKKSRAVVLNFGQAAVECHATLSPSWTSAKHRDHWLSVLEKYAKPLYSKRVDQIDTDDVMLVLTPLWQKRPNLAMQLRERVQRVLNWATAKGMRHGKNPASWRGNLQDWMAKPAPGSSTCGHCITKKSQSSWPGCGQQKKASALAPWNSPFSLRPDTVRLPAQLGMSFFKMGYGPGFGGFPRSA